MRPHNFPVFEQARPGNFPSVASTPEGNQMPGGQLPFWAKMNQVAENIASLVRLLSQDPVFYPWINSPPDAQPFDEQGVIVSPDVGVETTVLTLPVPTGWDGVLLGLGNSYLGPGALDFSIPSIVWRVYIDQRQVNGLNRIITPFGSVEFPRPISPLRVNTGQTLKYTVTINDAALPIAGTFIYCNFAGRFWPHRKS